MPAITVKDIPSPLLERIRARAREDRRSLNKEFIHLIELALDERKTNAAQRVQAQINAQTTAWGELCGRWQSDVDKAAETAAIYAARTPSRPVDWPTG